MKRLLFSLVVLSGTLLSACWSGTCEEPLCPYCDASGCYNEFCEPAYCNSNDDCMYLEYCNFNLHQCFPSDISCYYDWECPEGTICDRPTGTCQNPNVHNACHNDWECPENAYCNEYTGRCEHTQQCQMSSDCPNGFYCDERNVCAPSPVGPCVNDAQCGLGAFCDNGTCVNSGLCNFDSDCPTEAPVCDARGTCVPDPNPPRVCAVSADCEAGEWCRNGLCEALPVRDPAWNCQFNEHCGEHGVCVDGHCYNACLTDENCGTDQICAPNGYCQYDPAPGTECTLDVDCGGTAVCIDGLCHDACTANADCLNAQDHCIVGVCVASDMARPQCYTNADCMGGEECFEGICRVPCTDNDDCAGCPGNPICALGGYCMDNNDIHPECALSFDCDSGLMCVDALCVSSF